MTKKDLFNRLLMMEAVKNDEVLVRLIMNEINNDYKKILKRQYNHYHFKPIAIQSNTILAETNNNSMPINFQSTVKKDTKSLLNKINRIISNCSIYK